MIIAKIWMMQVVDQPALKLRSLLTSHNWRRLGGQAAASTFAKAISKSPAPSLLLSGEEASQYLQQLIPEVERQIATEHSRYGCVRWLWYLRRIPKEFFGGSYSTTFAYDRVLSESLTGSWPEPSTPVGSLLHFPVDDSAARQIARFLGRVKLLSHLHTVYRRIGKGAELDLRGSIAFANTPEAIETAIRLYDERHDQGYNFCAPGLGIATLTSAPERMDDVFELNGNSLLVSFAIAEPVRVNAPFPKGPEIVDAELDSWHALRVMPLQKVFDPFSDADSDPLPYLSLLAAVIQLLILLPAFLGRFVGAFAGTLQHGYFLLPERKLEELISEALADINVTLKERCPRVNWPADYGAWLSQLQPSTATNLATEAGRTPPTDQSTLAD